MGRTCRTMEPLKGLLGFESFAREMQKSVSNHGTRCASAGSQSGTKLHFEPMATPASRVPFAVARSDFGACMRPISAHRLQRGRVRRGPAIFDRPLPTLAHAMVLDPSAGHGRT